MMYDRSPTIISRPIDTLLLYTFFDLAHISAAEHRRTRDGIRVEVVINLYRGLAPVLLEFFFCKEKDGTEHTLAVYPGSVALKAPGILTVGLGLAFPPPLTLIWAQLT